jgi:asparagine synthase (glutamine-hydrolysing)
MPGIVGLITKMPCDRAVRELSTMVAALRHEAFYKTGVTVDESTGVYVGWVARGGSFSEGMPLCSETGDVSLVFSGEEYPEPGIIGKLKERGHSVKSEGPSYLVHVYEEDETFPRGLNGMFQGLVIDRRRGSATLFNDRYGMHPVYYHETEDAFYFSAEAKAILAVRREVRAADVTSLGEFVSLSCVLENRTLFKGVSVLPAASAWVFRNGAIEKKATYFQPREWEEQSALAPEPYYRELRERFSENLPRYFAAQEPLGVALTGGLDTRVIMAWQKSASGSLPCYTFGGTFRDCQDVLVARRVAGLCLQPHQVIQVGNEFLTRFPHYAERTVYLTEGGVDVYRSSDLYVSERAREIAPAKIVGTYGSEIIRQAVMFKPAKLLPGLFRSEFHTYIRQAEETYHRVRSVNPVTFAAFRQSPWYHHSILSLEQTQLTVRSPYLDNDFVRTVYRGPQKNAAKDDLRLRLIADGSPALSRIRSDRGVGGNGGFYSQFIRGLQEFTFKAEYAYDYGMPQWVSRADHAVAPLHLERLFLGRHKFSHYRLWYRNALGEYVRQILLDPRTLSRPYIERKAVEATVQGHLAGGRNYTTEIHKLLTMELLQRLFFESQ